MKMKKVLAILTAVLMLLTILAGCAEGENAKTEEQTAATVQEASGEKVKIIALINNFADQTSLNLAEGIRARCGELSDKVELTCIDCNSDVNVQLGQMEDAITQGFDAVILHATDTVAAGAAVDLCVEAGIVVVEINSETENKNYSAYVGPSDLAAGRDQAKYVFEKISGEGQVVNILGELGFSAQVLREDGTKEVLKDYPNIELVASQTGLWSRSEAMRIAEDYLQTYPNLKAILCQNDDMALGAIEARASQGRQDVIVAGVDGTADALKAVKDGTLDCTLYQDAVKHGRTAVDLALDILDGKTVEKNHPMDLVLIDSSNIDEYYQP